MVKKDIILIGGGGHCVACIDVIEATNKYNILGVFDVEEKIGQKVLDYFIIDSEKNLANYQGKNIDFFITLGQIKSHVIREKIFNQLLKFNVSIPTITSPSASVSKYSKIGMGTIIMHQAMINANSSIGVNCIINNKSLVEHDVVIGNHCHLSTNAVLNGAVKVGDNCFIGSSACVIQEKVINNNCIIGAGTLVHKDVSANKVIVGNPGKVIN